MKRILILIPLVFVLSGFTWGESITKEQGDAILKELQAIRQELNQIKQSGSASRAPAKPKRPTTASVSTLGNPILGDVKAPVTIVEFTDYQCPYCQKFYSQAYKKLKKNYVDTGKLRFVLRDLPLPNHQYAKSAAISAHCAGEQNKFWEMHDALFEGGGKLSQPDILGYAKSVGLETDSFKSCLTSGGYNNDIKQDVQDAGRVGIRGTPAFVVGHTTDDLVNGTLIIGTRPFTTFQKEIDKLLH
jgi:protein-disulfide isomerase